MIKKMTIVLVVLFVFGFVGDVCSGEEIIVPSNGTTMFSSVLHFGQMYEIRVGRTYNYHSASYNKADAEWSYESAQGIWIEQMQGFTYDNQDLQINETDYDWMGRENIGDSFTPHVFSPDHVYLLPWLGEEQALRFRINDAHYGDNSGNLTVEIIPEPATLLLLGIGCLILIRRRR